MQVVVHGITGQQLFSARVTDAPSLTFLRLKDWVAQASGIPAREQRLLAGTVEPLDGTLVLDYIRDGVQDEALFLTMVRRHPEQARWLEAIRADGRMLREAPRDIRADQEVAIAAALGCGDAFRYAAASVRGNRGIVLAALRAGAIGVLRHTSAELRRDVEVALAAVRTDPEAYLAVAPQLREHRDVALAAVRCSWSAYLHLPTEELRGDRELVEAAISANGIALRHLPAHLCEERDLVLRAVRQCGRALAFASPALREDREVALAAAMQDVDAWEFAAESLRSDRALMLRVVAGNWKALRCLGVTLHDDRDIALAAVRQYGGALQYASAQLRADAEVALAAIGASRGGLAALGFIVPPLSADAAFLLDAAAVDAGALEYAADELRGSEEFVAAARAACGGSAVADYLLGEDGANAVPHVPAASAEGDAEPRSFSEAGFADEMLRALGRAGLETPSPVQRRGLPMLLGGRHVLAVAPAGAGKSVMSAIAAVHFADPDRAWCQALVLVPTSRAAARMRRTVRSLRRRAVHRALSAAPADAETVVGATIAEDRVLIATPEDALLAFGSGGVDVVRLRFAVFDGADAMLQGGAGQVLAVAEAIPLSAQRCITASAATAAVLDLASRLLREPERVAAAAGEVAVGCARQYCVQVHQEARKFDALNVVYSTLAVEQGIVFCETRRKCEWLTDQLLKMGLDIRCSHQGMAPEDRDRALADFRLRSPAVLVAVGRVAGELDLEHVSLVVNYDLPRRPWEYARRMHVAGRSVAISFVTQEDGAALEEIEAYFSIHIDELPIDIADLL